jgi:signal transduction histidine kinase
MPEQDNEAMGTIVRAAVTEPFTRRAHLELLFCLAAIPLGLATFAVAPLAPVVVLLIPVLPRIARWLGGVHRGLAAHLLDERVPPPPPQPPGRGLLGSVWAELRDAAGWRAAAYQVLKLPAAFLEGYAAFLWLGGLASLTYPFWWGLFRNHPAGVRLSPVLVATPFPGRAFHVGTFPGTFAAFAVGLVMVLAAPWVARGATSVDRWLVRGLLGPGKLTQRIRDLEQTRALAVDDAAARLRRVERDLHDGAQIRLATLAMNLGMAKEKLGGGEPLDVTQARELVDAAHRGAKEALVELRDLAKGIHPPVLDNGLEDALATLAAGSAIPVELSSDVPERPAPAIETIAYFCAAELLANAAKHSHANRITIQAAGREGTLLLGVGDDGVGGADPARGSGLSGLAQRVRTVDGRLDIESPPGGPTRIVVELPLRT